jgi:hypothetical protein
MRRGFIICKSDELTIDLLRLKDSTLIGSFERGFRGV